MMIAKRVVFNALYFDVSIMPVLKTTYITLDQLYGNIPFNKRAISVINANTAFCIGYLLRSTTVAKFLL